MAKDEVNVEESVKAMEKAFVLFYASWCPHSQRFLPIFKEYAKNNPKQCLSVMIDSTPEVCDKYGIEYYPTLLLFKNGKLTKRLDAAPGVGLTKAQLVELTSNP